MKSHMDHKTLQFKTFENRKRFILFFFKEIFYNLMIGLYLLHLRIFILITILQKIIIFHSYANGSYTLG